VHGFLNYRTTLGINVNGIYDLFSLPENQRGADIYLEKMIQLVSERYPGNKGGDNPNHHNAVYRGWKNFLELSTFVSAGASVHVACKPYDALKIDIYFRNLVLSIVSIAVSFVPVISPLLATDTLWL